MIHLLVSGVTLASGHRAGRKSGFPGKFQMKSRKPAGGGYRGRRSRSRVAIELADPSRGEGEGEGSCRRRLMNNSYILYNSSPEEIKIIFWLEAPGKGWNKLFQVDAVWC
jgi:hypothetical protein